MADATTDGPTIDAGWRSGLKADISGGISAAIIALPLALGFGVAAFAPLGREYAATGALAGLIGASFTGIFAALFGGPPSQITGPTGPMTVVITATVARLMAMQTAAGDEMDAARVLLLTFATVLLGGVVQILMGLLRAGSAIKFIPYPVIAGFMNGIAVIIFVGQIEAVLGITEGRFWENFVVVPEIVATAAITIAAIYGAKRWLPKLPASLIGLLVGTGAYLLIGALVAPQLLVFDGNNFIVGEIPSGIPMPKNITAFAGLMTDLDASLLATLIPAAVVLGVLGAIDSLLTSLVADVATHTRHNSNRELIGQGIGNVVASLFGGISGAGATVRTLVNVDAGGRGRASGVTHGLLLLGILMFLGSLAGWIPMGVLGGILIVTAIGMVDTWSLSLVRKKTALLDLAVVLVVTVVTVAVDLMVAVGIGFAITTALFLRALTTVSLVRRKYRCTRQRSRHVRDAKAQELLTEHGERILVYELKGNLFFGSTSDLAVEVEAELAGTGYLIIDLEHVDTIDITGAELLKRMADRATDSGIELLVSHINPAHRADRDALETYLQELHVIEKINEDRVFDSVDRAIEAAEDRLLATLGHDDAAVEAAGAIRHCDLLDGLDDSQWALVEPHLEQREFAAGETIFAAGDPGEFLAMVEHGLVSVYGSSSKRVRLATFGAGIPFGEMSLISGSDRSATVHADVDSIVQVLTREHFERLLAEHEAVGVAILRSIGTELARRLRVGNEELGEVM